MVDQRLPFETLVDTPNIDFSRFGSENIPDVHANNHIFGSQQGIRIAQIKSQEITVTVMLKNFVGHGCNNGLEFIVVFPDFLFLCFLVCDINDGGR